MQRHGAGLRHAAQIPVVAGGRQRGREQHRRPAQPEVLPQESAGVQAELGQAQIAAEGRGLQDKMFVKGIRHPQPGPQVKVELQQRGVGLVRLPVLIQPGLQWLAQMPKLVVQRLVPFGLHQRLCPAALRLTPAPPGKQRAVHAAQRGLQPGAALAQQFAGGGEAALEQTFRVHIPGAVGEVVGLVDEEQVIPRRLKEPFEGDHRVKQVVVVPDDHIAPQAGIQPQLEGADGVPPGQAPERVGGEAGLVQRLPEGIPDALIVPPGIGAGLGGALPRIAQADLVLGGEGDAAQRQAGVGSMDGVEGLFGGGAGGTPGR